MSSTPLNILPSPRAIEPGDLVRYFHRAMLHWSRHLGEETPLDFGTVIHNQNFPDFAVANSVFDWLLPDGLSLENAMEVVADHEQAVGQKILRWVLAPAQTDTSTARLIAHLISAGFLKQSRDIFYLNQVSVTPERPIGGLKIIPARASYRHARELAGQWAQECGDDRLAEVSMLHLDDPHCDALIALRDGQAIARVTVLAVGEIGLVEELFVAPSARKEGVGRVMMNRAMEICARSLFKHVFFGVDPTNNAEGRITEPFIRAFGFKRVGSFEFYSSP